MAAAIASVIGAAANVAGTATSVWQASQASKARQDQVSQVASRVLESGSGYTDPYMSTFDGPATVTPTSGLFTPPPGSLLQVQPSARSYGWVVPVVLGVVGVGALAYLYFKSDD